MNKRMLEVMQRRGELLARIASQREQVAEIGARWQAPLALADQGLAAIRYLRSNPVLVAGVAALLVIRRRGVVGLVRGGWRVWKGYRSLTAFSAKLSSHL
ncbi:MAG: YqjK-like family protein [Betaproteobacteria bacterium]|nr:YqjK-like family protein [Betaproteobacteria bacterium]